MDESEVLRMDESEVLRFEQQKQITKLSEAIREGAKLKPQCKGFLFKEGKSCALGAAWEGFGGEPEEDCDSVKYEDIYRALKSRFGCKLVATIHGWNDNDMTREYIADKLAAQGY